MIIYLFVYVKKFKNTHILDYVETRAETTIFVYGTNPCDFKNRPSGQRQNVPAISLRI